MGRKIKRVKTSICVIVTTAIAVSISFCFADIPPLQDSEMMAAFSKSMDTELGDRMKAFFEEMDLKIDPNNSFSTTALGGEIILVPLISTDPYPMTAVKEHHQESQFLAYIDQGALGRFLVFLEVMKDQADNTTSFKIVFPSGRGLILNINPLCMFQIDGSQTGVSLQDYDDLDNSIVISDTCDTIRIIVIVFTAGCLISLNPIPCTIATVMETLYQFIC